MELSHHREGTGEPLVLIHGIGSRWQVWDPVLPLLTGERDVIALDLPGFGASAMPPSATPAGIGSLTRIVAEFLDGLGLERPHMAGNSLGGWVALELARQGRARTATALSPAGFHNRAEAVYQRSSFWVTVRLARAVAPRADRLLASPRGAFALAQYVAHPSRMPAEAVVPSVRALAGAPWFDETLIALTSAHFSGGEQIHVPVTIAWAEHDRVLLPRQAPRAARAIPAARRLTLRDCGHVPTYDDPEQVARVLLDGSGEAAARLP